MNTKPHWTERSVEDFVFAIAADFIVQLENKMESLSISQDELAEKLGVTKGRVSQVLNKPGNISISKIVEYAKALNMKVAIVAYEDGDPENKKGPINSEIFKVCWENSGKPRDFWAFQEAEKKTATTLGYPNYFLTLEIPVMEGPRMRDIYGLLGNRMRTATPRAGTVEHYGGING